MSENLTGEAPYRGYPGQLFGVDVANAAAAAHHGRRLMGAFGKYTPLSSYKVTDGARMVADAQAVINENDAYAQVLTGFDNPQQQFGEEFGNVTTALTNVATGLDAETPEGAEDARYEATADSIGAAVVRVAQGLVAPEDDPNAFTSTPMLRQLIAVRLGQMNLSGAQVLQKLPKAEHIAVAAPELLRALGYDNTDILRSVEANPASLRWGLRVPVLGGYVKRRLAALRSELPGVVAGIHGALPTSGAATKEAYDKFRELLDMAIPAQTREAHSAYRQRQRYYASAY